MPETMQLPKYSLGVGDRFAHQAQAQLAACILAQQAGLVIAPVWNKSNREHTFIGSGPQQSRDAADAAVKALHWRHPYFLDADHINLKTLDRYIAPCDFFTIDVADDIGKPAPADAIAAFLHRHPELIGRIAIPRVAEPFSIDVAFVRATAAKFLAAVMQAGVIYRDIAAKKGYTPFIAEISMDETDAPQTPPELLIILAAIADEGVPIQTIAPKFTGRFNKGVDYVGDIEQFTREFRDDLATIAYAVSRYPLPKDLKLSVHSGSDKYSIYLPIHYALRDFDAGVHVKTAGTTWLEEVIGLAESGGEGLAVAKQIYADAYSHAAELCAPYAAVIDVELPRLPLPAAVDRWSSDQFVRSLRHERRPDPAFNPDLRQLIHVGFKIAATMGPRYLHALEANEEAVARNVTDNLYRRHIRPIFFGEQP